MTKYILPLEVLGLLLTAALIGAVIIAMREKTGAEISQLPSGAKATRNGEIDGGHSQRRETTVLRPLSDRQTPEVSS